MFFHFRWDGTADDIGEISQDGTFVRFMQDCGETRTLTVSRVAILLAITVNALLTDTLISGQLYLRTVLSIPVFSSHSNSQFAHSRKRPLSPKWTRTLLKMEFGFFYCLCSLVSGHTTYCTNWLLWQHNRSVGISFLKLSVRLTWHQERFSVAIVGHLIKHNYSC